MSKRLLALASSLMMSTSLLALPGYAQTAAPPAPVAPAPVAPAPVPAPMPAAAAPAPAPAASPKPMHHVKHTAAAHHPAASAERVRKLQEALNAHGASLKVDGKMGPKTHAALVSFQKANHLKATGHADKETRAALMK